MLLVIGLLSALLVSMLLILQIEDLCNAYYTMKTFRKIYNDVMHPLLEVDLDLNDIQYDCSTTKS
jgi:hypothetical protein